MQDRSDRQLVNSTDPSRRPLRPNPTSQWSPAERFVSGSAPVGVQQGRLQMCSLFSVALQLRRDASQWNGRPIPKQPAYQGEIPNSLLTAMEVLVAWLGLC